MGEREERKKEKERLNIAHFMRTPEQSVWYDRYYIVLYSLSIRRL